MTSGTLELNPSVCPSPLFSTPWGSDDSFTVAQQPSVVGDLPPPGRPPTLLSLHCALNT